MKLILAFTAAALLTAPIGAAPPCRDARGRMAKCPTMATSAGRGIVKDKGGKCRWAAGPQRGKFVKCP